jgi:hypothetical protein
MSPGAHLNHAARTAFDAHRCVVVAVQHLEAAGADLGPARDDIAELIEDTADFAGELQCLADAYGHNEARGRAALPASNNRRAA